MLAKDKASFIRAAEAFLATCAPELDYNSVDLFAWITAAWPYDGTPEDAASEFAEAVQAQRDDGKFTV